MKAKLKSAFMSFIVIYGMDITLNHFVVLVSVLTVLDDATTSVQTYLMKDKSEASQLVKKFCIMVHT